MNSPTSSPNLANSLLRFQWSVRALAQPSATQMALFPGFVCVPDELALDFDEHRRSLDGSAASNVLSATAELDKQLAAMSGSSHEDLWEDDALHNAPEWDRVRQLARAALAHMGWSNEPPPRDRAIYVGPPATTADRED